MTREESSETRIALLENNHQTLMEKLDDILERFDKFETKLDIALEKKADKTLVDSLKETVDDLKTWKIKIMVVGAIILFLTTFFKDSILEIIKRI